jgi:cytoskeletal protein RodZ
LTGPMTKNLLMMTTPAKTNGVATLRPAVFTRTRIGSALTLGERLLQTRESLGLSVRECADKLGIQEKYLEAIESSHYTSLPGDMYARGWIRKYGQLLGLAPQELLPVYERESSVQKKIEGTDMAKPRRRLRRRILEKISLRQIVILVIIVGALGYLVALIYNGTKAPSVTFNPLLHNFQTQEHSTIIAGKTEPGVILSINNQRIDLDAQGQFSQTVSLYTGINTITIEAHAKHSRSFVQEMTVVRDTPPTLSLTTPTTTTPTTTTP